MALQVFQNGNGFLSTSQGFKTGPPPLYITAETDDFDEVIIQAWRDEGYNVQYIPFGDGGKAYTNTLRRLGDSLSIGESFAIVAFGDAAGICLDVFQQKHTPRLCALVAYYPSTIPDPKNSFPNSFRVLVHLAGGVVGVRRNPEVLGIQGKKKTYRRKVGPGIGTGGFMKLGYPAYTYEGVESGFAESDLDEYDKVAERVAWSRSLATIRKGFIAEVNIEIIREQHTENKSDKPEETVQKMAHKPFVNYVPTMTGGVGKKELVRFYKDFFAKSNPPSMVMRLLSRTIGVDRVVDEIHMSFKHTQEMYWMLPGIPATDKQVDVAIVSVVAVRGGKLYSENVYWDQASVLMQLGLLDPKYIPKNMRDKGIEELPVWGAESARRVVDEESEPSNELIVEWE